MRHTYIMKGNLNKEERGPTSSWSVELVVSNSFEVIYHWHFFYMTRTYGPGSKKRNGVKITNVKSLEYLVEANWRIPSELLLLKLSRITSMFTTMLSFYYLVFDASWRCQIIRCLETQVERYSGLYPPTSKCKVCDLHAGGVRFHFL